MLEIFREIEVFLQTKVKEISKKQEEFIEGIKTYLVPIKLDRSYPKKRIHSMNEYSHNLRIYKSIYI